MKQLHEVLRLEFVMEEGNKNTETQLSALAKTQTGTYKGNKLMCDLCGWFEHAFLFVDQCK